MFAERSKISVCRRDLEVFHVLQKFSTVVNLKGGYPLNFSTVNVRDFIVRDYFCYSLGIRETAKDLCNIYMSYIK